MLNPTDLHVPIANNYKAYQQQPKRAFAVTLFVIAAILFITGLTLGAIGLAHHSRLPLWLKNIITPLGKEGCISAIVGGYITSTTLAEYAGPIHSQALLEKEAQVNPKTKFEKMIETATRVPRVILALAIEIAFFPITSILSLIACYKSSSDPSHPKTDKIPILQIHGSNSNELKWAFSWPWLRKEEYGSVFTIRLDGSISNKDDMGIDNYAEEVRKKIEEIKRRTGQNEVILIGHSMGGLVAAYYAENLAKDSGTTVNHVISIATPWNGAPLLNNLDENNQAKRFQQMREDNNFLTTLTQKASQSNADHTRTYYSIGSTTDYTVPGASSILTDSQDNNRMYSWLGHDALIAYPGTWLTIRSWLDSAYRK